MAELNRIFIVIMLAMTETKFPNCNFRRGMYKNIFFNKLIN